MSIFNWYKKPIFLFVEFNFFEHKIDGQNKDNFESTSAFKIQLPKQMFFFVVNKTRIQFYIIKKNDQQICKCKINKIQK